MEIRVRYLEALIFYHHDWNKSLGLNVATKAMICSPLYTVCSLMYGQQYRLIPNSHQCTQQCVYTECTETMLQVRLATPPERRDGH